MDSSVPDRHPESRPPVALLVHHVTGTELAHWGGFGYGTLKYYIICVWEDRRLCPRLVPNSCFLHACPHLPILALGTWQCLELRTEVGHRATGGEVPTSCNSIRPVRSGLTSLGGPRAFALPDVDFSPAQCISTKGYPWTASSLLFALSLSTLLCIRYPKCRGGDFMVVVYTRQQPHHFWTSTTSQLTFVRHS